MQTLFLPFIAITSEHRFIELFDEIRQQIKMRIRPNHAFLDPPVQDVAGKYVPLLREPRTGLGVL